VTVIDNSNQLWTMGEPAQEETMSAEKTTQKSTKSTTARGKKSVRLSDEERSALKERTQELKTEARRGRTKDGESDVLAKIAEMPELDRAMAERIHAIVKASAPELSPRTWYGMPAYANRNGKVVCYFTPASKFKERYATLGFNADANLDEGAMWATAFALTELTATEEARIAELVKKAVS
jgi:uncharacterized protein YdhG (YjbR/CyaY superfamily)